MHSARDLSEAVGAWLYFEMMCGRNELFDERYLSYPVGQYLSARYGKNLRTEYEHPVLAPAASGRGDKPRIDFVVVDENGSPETVIETKWLRSAYDIPAVIRDLIGLELVCSQSHCSTFFLAASKKRVFSAIFKSTQFAAHPEHPQSRTLLPTEHNGSQPLRIFPGPVFRRKLFLRACKEFGAVPLPCALIVQREKPFPETVTSNQYLVYAWRVSSLAERNTFTVDDLRNLSGT